MAAEAVADGGDSADSPLQEAEALVKELEELEDYYFAADKDERMKKVGAAAVAKVEEVVDSQRYGRQQDLKARGHYLRGRAASFLAGQERAAEEQLSKAIKLNPLLPDAWNALGEVYWNGRDIPQAKQCFEQALELCGPNVVSLRNLSMALRALEGASSAAADTSEKAARRAANYTKALAKAKEAVALGPTDPLSWETLGNAYVGDFFVNGKRPDEISRALIAYEKADAAYTKMGKRNPTLHFNRAMAARYVEDYDLALRSFKVAHDLGNASALDEAMKICDLVQKVATQVSRQSDLKAKRLKDLTVDFPPRESCRTLKELQQAQNAQVPLVVRVVSLMDRKEEVPVIVLCCDQAGDFLVLSLYNTDLAKLAAAIVPMKTMLQVSQPEYKEIKAVSLEGAKLSYPAAVVGHPSELTVCTSAGTGPTLALASARSMVFSTGADRGPTEKEAKAGGQSAPEAPRADVWGTFTQCQQHLVEVAKKAAKTGEGKEVIIRALVPCLKSLVEAELGKGAGSRLSRVEAMFDWMARGEVFQEEIPEHGKRFAPGYIEGLQPRIPFHSTEGLPWVTELRQHWTEIRDELRQHLDDSSVWVPGAYAESNAAYGPTWRIAGVLTADKWEDKGVFKATQRILKRLPGVVPFEIFFARLPAGGVIAPHSDNLSYILTSHLALELEAGKCVMKVGNYEKPWEEGQVMIFDTTWIHEAWNHSSRNRYVLVLRFWHPGLTVEERRAIHMSHTLLAGTPDPAKLRQKGSTGTADMATSLLGDQH